MTQFATTFRGYDRAEVDSFVKRTHDALASDDPIRRAKAEADAQAVTFRIAWRGYDRENVDHYLRRIARPSRRPDLTGLVELGPQSTKVNEPRGSVPPSACATRRSKRWYRATDLAKGCW
jgi:DivIVA domain-containing protein